MVQVTLLGIQQNFDFNTKKIRSYVVFNFGGKTIHAEVDNIEEVQALVSAGLNGSPSAPTASATAPAEAQAPPQPIVQEDSHESIERVVNWTKIPDDVISPLMKRALSVLEVPQEMESSQLRKLMDEIQTEFSDEDWASLGADTQPQQIQEVAQVPVQVPTTSPGFSAAPPQPPPQPPPPPAPQPRPPPAVGEITWHDGSPILPGASVRARTVQADEWGYPIVSNAGVDPGEVVGDGDERDEDGVGQV